MVTGKWGCFCFCFFDMPYQKKPVSAIPIPSAFIMVTLLWKCKIDTNIVSALFKVLVTWYRSVDTRARTYKEDMFWT